MAVTIRPATAADLAAMVAIKHDAGLAAWPHILPAEVIEALPFLPRWEAAVASPDPRVSALLAELNGRVVGFTITRPSGDADALPVTGELDGFYTDPGAWGAGAGRALLAASTEALRQAGFSDATLWTAALNHRPRRIYEAAGWRVDGTERRRSFGGVEFTEVRYRRQLGEEG
jgi:GNAT superfamily N-acetyltransferase